MPTLKKIHSCNSHRPPLQPKIAREYFFHQPEEEFYFFSPTLRCFNFFANAQPTQTDPDDKRTNTVKSLTDKDCTERWTRTPAGNSVLPQLAVTCKIEAECSYQTFVQVDSEVLRNRQLRQHANRWR
jgi:hypothetical protein